MNRSGVTVTGIGGGSVAINVQNLRLGEEFSGSFIRAGISSESTNSEAQAGDIVINVEEKILLNDSRISNSVSGIGNSGNILINTSSLEISGDSGVFTTIFGRGNAGTINITASEDITINNFSTIGSFINPDGEGNAGEVNISATNLNLTNGGGIFVDRAVNITASGDVNLDGETSFELPSRITSNIPSSGIEKNLGEVTISATNLNLTNGGEIFSEGDIDITASGDVNLDGETSVGSPSRITSRVFSEAEESLGEVRISATNLNLANGAEVLAEGDIDITASGDVNLDGETLNATSSNISNSNLSDRDRGEINISTANLNLFNGGNIRVATFNNSDVKGINVVASGDVNVDGENSSGFASGINSLIGTDAVSNSGEINIDTTNLTLTNGGRVSSETRGRQDSSSLNIDADFIKVDGINSGVFNLTGSIGNSGAVNINTSNLAVQNNAEVSVSNFIATELRIENLIDESGNFVRDSQGNPIATIIPVF
ncbi:MAG: filamentous hemagglutinin, partial [Bacteroidota bacterium]